MLPRQRTIYSGHVQGVGFRATTLSIARSFPITGFVRNEPDGSVLCESQGYPKDLAAFHLAVRERLAHRITNESSQPMASVLDEADFSIRY